jgi:hypothetical protein
VPIIVERVYRIVIVLRSRSNIPILKHSIMKEYGGGVEDELHTLLLTLK